MCSKAHAGINVNVELHVYWCEGLYNCINVPMVNEKDVLFTRDIKKPKTGLQNTWWMDLELGAR